MGDTSTTTNFYTGLKQKSKIHFYGRAAAEAIFSDSLISVKQLTRLLGGTRAKDGLKRVGAIGLCRGENTWKCEVVSLN